MREVPDIPKDLLDYLNETVSSGVPTTGMKISEIFFHAGQRELVETLKVKYRKQQEFRVPKGPSNVHGSIRP